MRTDKYTQNTVELGRKLASIISDPAARDAFLADTETALQKNGGNSELTVYADTVDHVHLIIPAQVDATRVAADDAAYFEELGRLALGNCVYKEELPE
ncbi:hypothetical protein E1180_21100 [Roseibium denhamense]|uniref:NHLP leader peptide family natural product n=1 Tax=Roseibium denhamense TaxID=76305 RepID=A0ABY1NQG9_9HYPH|nr:hypothetical protein [Roseibium denhamense]MTI08004.1 hypothetical protein [Roseibium denhamense]SMP15576.1 hypothetical protein SAMN06265374_1589 [Roseibium denhamense]